MADKQSAPGDLELVQAFVNTRDVEDDTERLSSPSALVAWLAEHGLIAANARAGAADLRRFLEVREALRASLAVHTGEAPDPAAPGVLDAASRRARLGVRFGADGSARVQPAAGGVDGALGRLLAIVAAAMADGTWSRLKACRSDSCRWAFYDSTRNRSGAWCTMDVCGNRTKVRRFREREVRAAGAARPASPAPRR